MTIYVKELIDKLNQKYGDLNNESLIKKLFEIGVVDHTLCKVMIVREFVDEQVKNDIKKIDAMWNAANKFACSYEYVRKCVYYYNDIKM